MWIIGVLIYLNPLGLCHPDKWRPKVVVFFWCWSSQCLPFSYSRGTLNAVRVLSNPREFLHKFMSCTQLILWILDAQCTKANFGWIMLTVTVKQMCVQSMFSLLNRFCLAQTLTAEWHRLLFCTREAGRNFHVGQNIPLLKDRGMMHLQSDNAK